MKQIDQLVKEAQEKRKRNEERLRRRMELGYDGWQKRSDGSFFKSTPKGIQTWYDTKTLVRLVSEAFDRNEKLVVDVSVISMANGVFKSVANIFVVC